MKKEQERYLQILGVLGQLTTDAPPYTNTELVEYRMESDRIIKIEELTSNVKMDPATFEVTGDGVFDNIMRTLNVHMLAQYKAQRLKAENFATVYVGVVPTVLQESIKFLLQKEATIKKFRSYKSSRRLV